MRKVEFDGFLKQAVSAAKNKNSMYYHACCNSWTTMRTSAKKESHHYTVAWKKILKLPDRVDTKDELTEEQKQRMKEKLEAYGCRFPTVINIRCAGTSQVTVQPKIPLQHYQPPAPPQEMEDEIAAYQRFTREVEVSVLGTSSGR